MACWDIWLYCNFVVAIRETWIGTGYWNTVQFICLEKVNHKSVFKPSCHMKHRCISIPLNMTYTIRSKKKWNEFMKNIGRSWLVKAI